MADKKNSDSIYSRVGVGIFLLSLIIGVIGMKYKTDNLIIASFPLFIIGLGLISFGMTRAKIEDKEYQSFTRRFGKAFLIIIPLIIILGVIGVFIPALSIISVIVLIVLSLLLSIFEIYSWYKTYKYIKRINRKISPEERRKQIILLIIAVILGLLAYYIINYVILK